MKLIYTRIAHRDECIQGKCVEKPSLRIEACEVVGLQSYYCNSSNRLDRGEKELVILVIWRAPLCSTASVIWPQRW